MCNASGSEVINLQSRFPVKSLLILRLVNTGIMSKKHVSPSIDMTDKPYEQCASKTNMTQYLWVGNSHKSHRMFWIGRDRQGSSIPDLN